jgi:integrase
MVIAPRTRKVASLRDYVRLLLLTGQRRGEIAHISLEGDEATIPGEYTKNGRPHFFPVGALSQDLLAKPRIWGGWGKSKARLELACGVKNWSIHDLRRTFSTFHAELGTPAHVSRAATRRKAGAQCVKNAW